MAQLDKLLQRAQSKKCGAKLMTNILVSGISGNMGKFVVNAVSKRSNCSVVAGVGRNCDEKSPFSVFSSFENINVDCDVIIDFSNPSLTEKALSYAEANEIPIVICTTGLSDDQIADIKRASKKIPVFFSGNMSLGINLIIELAKKATSVLSDSFDIEIIEKHHNQKIDAPSGTALMIADAVKGVCADNPDYVYDRHMRREKRPANEIGIHSVRGGTIVGEHEIIFAGNNEVVTISHSAQSKEVFAVGAINAAIYLATKPSGLYSMSDLLA